MLPVIEDIRAEGRTSLRQIARGLTERGIRTAWGRDWTPTAVKNLVSRFAQGEQIGRLNAREQSVA